MSELNKDTIDGSNEAVYKESSPKSHKKEKKKYQAFRSDDSLSSENEEMIEPSNRFVYFLNLTVSAELFHLFTCSWFCSSSLLSKHLLFIN